ncbi:MAG TPA: glycosyltransferase [Allosphingosinicella sp.]|nr:glycosyltransferase [Allosphingosinicella sp.]
MADRLTFRNAIADWDHIPSDLAAEGSAVQPVAVTIVLTVYRRFETLVEAVDSVLRQDWDRPFAIIVSDDDPASQKAHMLLERLPALKQANFRYYVNRQNLGLFGNWNRCIQLVESEWMTILNDDDQLDPSFLRDMFRPLDANPEIDGLVCRKRILDERAHKVDALPPLWRRTASQFLVEARFRGQASRRIKPYRLFWEPILGNGCGFLFRTAKAREIGGYYPEEFPSSDWWFFVRYASRYHLRQHRAVRASVRMGENESSKLSTIKQGLHSQYRLQRALAGNEAPRLWSRLIPLIMAHHRDYLEGYWNVKIPPAELEQKLGLRLPPSRPRLYRALKVLLGGS